MKDYEKKYKEALERAKKYKLKEDLIITQDIFPELAESDDEKIRKALISILKSDFEKDTTIYDISVGDIIAWLEKQGERKPYGQRQECTDCQFNYAGECKGSCQMKREEQKPAFDMKTPEESLGIDSDTYNKIVEECIYEYEKGRADTIAEMQKPWSEEDEQTYFKSVEALEDFGKFELADWLKEHKNQFLKSQSQWKPSDEQMEALKGVQEGVFRLGILESLYQYLKKLRD